MREIKNRNKKKQKQRLLDALIFIDTNIFLDFYRNSDKSYHVSMIDHIKHNINRIISTDQILMEYNKNRHTVIKEAIIDIKQKKFELKIPPFVKETQLSQSCERYLKHLTNKIRNLQNKILQILENPQIDPIYQCLRTLMSEDSPYYLGRNNKERYKLRHMARKRFCLGYPPRKDDDNSIGDAINWEWIVECAIRSKKSIIIVSRDSDYGFNYQKNYILNDWLKYEFQERVGKKRKIIYSPLLSEALKQIGVVIKDKDITAEKQLIKKENTISKDQNTSVKFQNLFEKLLKQNDN